jgi:hypothetical protein
MYVNPARLAEISFKNRRITIQIRRFHDNGEVELAVREMLPLQKPRTTGVSNSCHPGTVCSRIVLAENDFWVQQVSYALRSRSMTSSLVIMT